MFLCEYVQYHFYNIHDIIRVLSEVVLHELEYFACKPFLLEDADMVVKEVSSISKALSLYRKVIVNQSAQQTKLMYTEHFGPFGAQFSIVFMNNRIEVSVNRVISGSRHVLYVNLVEPLLRFLFISKGYLLLHSACIAKRVDEAILISAPPDTGKTTIVLKCMERDFALMSDDMTILSLPNQALCFPKPMTISSHTYKTAVTVSEADDDRQVRSLSLQIRSIIHSKRGRMMMRKLGRLNVPIFTLNAIGQKIFRPPKYKVDDLLSSPIIMNKSKICTNIFLEIGDQTKEPNRRLTENIASDAAVEKAIENSDDAFLFPPYKEIVKYLRINGKSADELLKAEKTMLKELYSSVNCTIMKREDRSWYRDIMAIDLANVC
jgi:dolichol-phosphate mannosyltransferase